MNVLKFSFELKEEKKHPGRPENRGRPGPELLFVRVQNLPLQLGNLQTSDGSFSGSKEQLSPVRLAPMQFC